MLSLFGLCSQRVIQLDLKYDSIPSSIRASMMAYFHLRGGKLDVKALLDINVTTDHCLKRFGDRSYDSLCDLTFTPQGDLLCAHWGDCLILRWKQGLSGEVEVVWDGKKEKSLEDRGHNAWGVAINGLGQVAVSVLSSIVILDHNFQRFPPCTPEESKALSKSDVRFQTGGKTFFYHKSAYAVGFGSAGELLISTSGNRIFIYRNGECHEVDNVPWSHPFGIKGRLDGSIVVGDRNNSLVRVLSKSLEHKLPDMELPDKATVMGICVDGSGVVLAASLRYVALFSPSGEYLGKVDMPTGFEGRSCTVSQSTPATLYVSGTLGRHDLLSAYHAILKI